MKKALFFLPLFLLATLTQAQPWRDSIPITYTINPPATGWLYNYKPGGTRVATIFTPAEITISAEDSLKVALLMNLATAIIEYDINEEVLLSVLCSHISEPDFCQHHVREVFPVTLDLHINRNTPFAAAAGRLKRRYFPEKD